MRKERGRKGETEEERRSGRRGGGMASWKRGDEKGEREEGRDRIREGIRKKRGRDGETEERRG